jgi:hypothetical protein
VRWSIVLAVVLCGCLSDEDWIAKNKGFEASCTSDDECFSGLCKAGKCARAVGEACTDKSECAGNACLTWTKGECSGSSCPTGYVCGVDGVCYGINAICSGACTDDAHCLQGNCVTREGASQSWCRKPCQDDGDCSSTAVCADFGGGQRYCDAIKP